MFDTTEQLLTKIRLGEDSVLELKVVEFRGDKIIGSSMPSLSLTLNVEP
jgi:hypothetical protein